MHNLISPPIIITIVHYSDHDPPSEIQDFSKVPGGWGWRGAGKQTQCFGEQETQGPGPLAAGQEISPLHQLPLRPKDANDSCFVS